MKSPIKRGAFSPYLKVRMDLYNSPDMRQLRHDGAAEAFGCLMVIALDLARNSNGVGTWDMIGEFALKCRKSKKYIERLIKDYGLFDYDGAVFQCRLIAQSFSIDPCLDDALIDSTGARRADMCARSAQKDNNNYNYKKNKQKKCVCLEDTHSEFETRRAGVRYASHGQPLPDDAPPQRHRNWLYSYRRREWVPADEFDREAETAYYQTMKA